MIGTLSSNRMVARTSATLAREYRTHRSISRTRLVSRGRSNANAAISYENETVVKAIMKNEGLSRDLALKCFKAALRFLVNASSGGDNVPTRFEDRGWHTFILHTKDYAAFCDKYFGHYMHHTPGKFFHKMRDGSHSPPGPGEDCCYSPTNP